MLKWWTTRVSQQQQAEQLYDAIITHARTPYFYSHLNIPDSIDGRYELIVLHLFLVMERLRDADETAAGVARRTLERFVEDMDDCMREIGVSDLKVPKQVKKAATGFYDRATMLRDALGSVMLQDGKGDGDDQSATRSAVHKYLSRVFAEQTAGLQTPVETDVSTAALDIEHEALTDYVLTAAQSVSEQPINAILDGQPAFPPPSSFDKRR